MTLSANSITTSSVASTSSFVSSLGVNTHLSWWDTAWGVGNGQWAGAETKIETELSYLGVSNIRDAAPQGSGLISEMTDLGKLGYKFDLEQNVTNGQVALTQDLASMAALQSAAPGSIVTYEGANEYNVNSYSISGQSSLNNLAWGKVDDQVSNTALKATSGLSGVKYVAAATANVSSIPSVQGTVDSTNWHVYGGGIGTQLSANLASAIKTAAASSPGSPVEITEAGVSSAASTQSTWGLSGDEFTQGVIDTNAVLDSFKDGASNTYLYNLMDNAAAADQEDNFGLFNANGTAKAVATDIHNLTTILADTGANAKTFATTAPSYTITGMPSTASEMVLQKSDGTNDLVMWNSGATLWNSTTNTEATVTATPVTVSLGGTHQTVSIYDPLVSSSPIQTLTNASTVTLSLAKDPLIVQVSAGTVSTVPATTVIGTGTDVLALKMSEDAYQGDAQFTVSVGGTQVGGTQTVVASHAAGQTQEFDFHGSWGTGDNAVSVNFLNDSYGGSSSLDRNLYVNSATSDARTIVSTPVAMNSQGAVTIGNTAPDTLSLQVSEDAYQGNAQFTVSVGGVQVGGTQTVTASHAAGATQEVDLHGNWGTGDNAISVNFLNDSYGGSSSLDRNLYVNSATLDGKALVSTPVAMDSQGAVTIGNTAPDTLSLQMSEDAYQGNAQFTVTVDGTQVGGTQTVTAAHASGATQEVDLHGAWSAGTHTVAVNFLNDAYGGASSLDRNLYVNSATFDGATVSGAAKTLLSQGTQSFSFTSTSAATVSSSASVTASATTSTDAVTTASTASTSTASISFTAPASVSASAVTSTGSSLDDGFDTVLLTSSTGLGASGKMAFIQGTGTSTVSMGSGNSLLDVVKGAAGGTMTLSDFTAGKDFIHLDGYAGSTVMIQQAVGGGSQIVLSDNTNIIIPNASVSSVHGMFA